jgi:hypothetical protein
MKKTPGANRRKETLFNRRRCLLDPAMVAAVQALVPLANPIPCYEKPAAGETVLCGTLPTRAPPYPCAARPQLRCSLCAEHVWHRGAGECANRARRMPLDEKIVRWCCVPRQR